MNLEVKVISEVVGRTGILCLNRLSKLNVLDEDMIKLLASGLSIHEASDSVDKVLITSSSPRAFCAGGDVVSVLNGIESGREVDFFFKKEYAFDESLYNFSKPLIALARGIVFGGGMGIFSGCSTRICTDDTLFAMPEVTIGFFPDVASSYFLQRAPMRWRLLMGLCGARVKASWAHKLGLVDFIIEGPRYDDFLDFASSGDSVSSYGHFLAEVEDAEFAVIDELISSIDNLSSIDDFHSWACENKDSDSSFLRTALASYFAGSRLSSAVTWLLFHWSQAKGVKECFEKDLELSSLFGRSHDFKEGVRALLIDKDKNPRFEFFNYEELRGSMDEVYIPLFR